MKKNFFLKKNLVVGIIILFIFTSFISSISGFSEVTNQIDIEVIDDNEFQEGVLVSCSTFGFPGKLSHESSIPRNEAEFLYEKIEELQIEVARDPLSDKSQKLQREIITIAKEHNLLPKSVSIDEVLSTLSPIKNSNKPILPIPRAPGIASETFCNYVSTGTGSALPIIIFPRLVPILLTPIPRLFVRWSTYEGVTSCGGLRSGRGFIASGAQRGIALGFWGIGFSIFIPPVKAYGLFGYALYASVNAENISFWPPNYPPEVTILNPLNGAQNVPISTSELSFHISDINKALMNYTVTTSPDVGSGSGSNKPDGTYSVTISGLEGTEEYTWHIQVDDGVHEVDVYSSFTTEAVAPIVSDPKPEDGKRYVSLDLSQLSFHLSDPQNDLMDYTVETVPDIGSGSGTGVSEGTYSVTVGGLDYSQEYTWFVNVTDGTNWKHKVFTFQTEPIMVFDPFEEGWKYRKKITIDHTQVTGDLTNFPVLVCTIDSDLCDKAQDDGDDILFMNNSGVATRLYHEIEYFDDSSGELIAWVNITNLPSKKDMIFYIYYSNSDCCNQQAPERVWDSNFVMVQHMNDNPDVGHILDSTNNDNDGKKFESNGPVEINGKIGRGKKFDGINDFIKISDSDSLDVSKVTLEAWVYIESYPGVYQRVISKDGREGHHTGYHLITHENNCIFFRIFDGNWIGGDFDANALSIGTWIYIVGKYNGETLYAYKNGVLQNTKYSHNGTISSGTDDLAIGTKMSRPDWTRYLFDGTIDEIRISNIARSNNWISSCYNNQNNPSNFLSFGPEETGP